MKTVIHILDDPALGGVTRLLESIMQTLGKDHRQQRLVLRSSFRLPPRIDADVIVIHFTLAWSKLSFLFALRMRCPQARLILVEHSYTGCFETACVPWRMRFRGMLRLGYRAAHRIVAVSEGQARWMISAGLTPTGKVTVIPCILELAPFEALPPPVRTASRPMILGAYGRFHTQKGFDTLMAAMRLVPPDVARLELAGFGPEEITLRHAAMDVPNVAVRGRVDPLAFLTEVDAVAIPSRWEAGAVCCWEVRAAARPLVVSSVDGLPEQVPPEIGFVVAPENPAELAAAIVRLAGSDRAAMSARARLSTVGAFARATASWRALFEDPVGARKSKHFVRPRPSFRSLHR